jgi:large subunit ribosomal protein L14e
MLKRAEAFDLEFYFEDNADWRKVVSFPYSGSKFDAFTPFGDIVRELLINLYRNYGRKLTRSAGQRAVAESAGELMEQSHD